MSARFPFSEETKPEKDSIVLIHAFVDETRKSGQYFIGLVLGYGKNWYGDDVISLMMYINNRETDASVKTKNIVWWTPIPLTKTELWSGKSTIE